MPGRTLSGKLAGRDLELRKAPFSCFWEMQGVRTAEPSIDKAASYHLLSVIAFWSDTGEKVFADWRAVNEWPMEDYAELLDLLNEALEFNGMGNQKPKANGATADGIEARPS
jgi:hypothetical protein